MRVAPVLRRNSEIPRDLKLMRNPFECMHVEEFFALVPFLLHTNCVCMKINKCLFCLMSNFGNDMWKLRELDEVSQTRQEGR